MNSTTHVTIPSIVFPWLRYWFRHGDRPSLTNDYLIPPNQQPGWFSAGQTTTLKTLPGLTEVPCLVLLGDPGKGKTSEIEAEFKRLAASSPAGVKVKLLNLKSHSAALIEKVVFNREEFIGWTEGRHALVLFFDSMDECWRRVPELSEVILTELEPHLLKKDLPPIYLRLGCRSAEWREEIESRLRNAFGEKNKGEKVQVWELAPLTQEDVRVAATATGLALDKFLPEVQAREVNAFAAHPITLNMLLSTAKEGGRLGSDRAGIYHDGCELLCRDLHQGKKDAPRLTTTPQQRLACASYLAALCVLSNRYLIHGSVEERPADEAGTVLAQDVLRQKTLLLGNDFEFTRDILAETLQTGLFDAQASSLFSWSHQSYAEYLAARYLQLRSIPNPEVIQSLCDTSTGTPRLWPQVEETACWLAPLAPEFFNALVAANAEVFVRCDPSRLAPGQRAQIVSGYIEQVRRHEAQASRGREISRLDRLKHPDLVKQLAPLIMDDGQDIFVRDLAMDIVRACELRELTDLLLRVMLTPNAHQRMRHNAGAALREWANADIREKLKARLEPALLDDDDVRGCVLSILWPESLTPQELVPFLTKPARSNYYGSYQRFFSEEFHDSLDQVDLVPLIKWAKVIAEDPEVPGLSSHARACEAVLLAAYRRIDNAEIRAEFMEVIKDHVRRHGALFKLEGRDLAAELASRKIFWRALIAGEIPVRNSIIDSRLDAAGLIHEDDFDWVMDEVAAATPRERDRWLELAFWIFQPQTRLEQVTRILPFAKADSAVHARMLAYTASPLVGKNGEPNWQKDSHYQKEKRDVARAQRKSFSQQVDECIAGYESTRAPHLIWGLPEWLNRSVKDFDEPGSNNANDDGWKHLSEEQRARMLAIAPGFLLSVKVDHTEVHDPKPCYRSYRAGTSFLLMLIEAGSPWPQAQSSDFWNDWAPVIVHYRNHAHRVGESVWQKLFKLAFDNAKLVFRAAIARWLAEQDNRHFPLNQLELLPVGTDSELEDVLLTGALAGKHENETRFDFFGFLLRQKSAKTEATLASWLTATDSPDQKKAHFAGALLLCFRPHGFSAQVMDRVLADSVYGRGVMSQLAHMHGVPCHWCTAVDSERLARLWEWLNKEFPGDPYENSNDGTVTIRHEIAMFRNHLINFITKRGTEETVEAICGLAARHPDAPWLGQVLAEARQIMRRESWKPPTARAAIAYLARPGTPPLCNDADLADAVKASLHRYQELLKGPRPLTELWNETAGQVKVWTPKDENNLSDCLARHLERELKAHSVSVTRETELSQSTPAAAGDEPDILVTAPNASNNVEMLRVVIEVKCSWNSQTLSGMKDQLLDRYLRGLRCGIYVTAHFNCPSWSETDKRKSDSLSGRPLADIISTLEAERQRLAATTTKRIDLVVIDAGV